MEYSKLFFPLLAVSLLVTGCGGDSNNDIDKETGEEIIEEEVKQRLEDEGGDNLPEPTSVTLDAADSGSYTYYNLITEQVVELSAEEAAESTEWHLGFSRYNVILNGGQAGPGNVAGALLEAQDDFYKDNGEADEEVFLNALPALELSQLYTEVDLDSLEFVSDDDTSAIEVPAAPIPGGLYDYGWYNYNFSSHQTSLNSDNWWVMRNGEGDSFTRFHASAYESVEGILTVTFEYFLQPSGEVEYNAESDQVTFSMTTISQPGITDEQCADFDSGAIVDCATAGWDLMLKVGFRSQELWTNSGVTGDGEAGAFGPFSEAEAAEFEPHTLSPFHFLVDRRAGIFEENSWYAYNLEGKHKLFPNYRVYAIDTDSEDDDAPIINLQLIGYYNEGDVSGNPTIRFVTATIAENN